MLTPSIVISFQTRITNVKIKQKLLTIKDNPTYKISWSRNRGNEHIARGIMEAAYRQAQRRTSTHKADRWPGKDCWIQPASNWKPLVPLCLALCPVVEKIVLKHDKFIAAIVFATQQNAYVWLGEYSTPLSECMVAVGRPRRSYLSSNR